MNDFATPGFATIDEALDELRAGRLIVVVDDEDRENEGDLTCAAEFATPDAINFMAKYGRGLICLTLTEDRADALSLAPMVDDNTSRFGTAFTESIEAREGVTTGISAADRSHTIQVAISPQSTARDLARPGHVFPLRARKGGVLVRAGQTEASVDLARMAGLIPAGVICEIMNDDGSMARVPDLKLFCAEHGLKMVTVADLIRHRLQHERYVHRQGVTTVHLPQGEFRMIAYGSEVGPSQACHESHVALVYGDVAAAKSPVLVRVQTHCFAGSVLGESSCDCRESLEASLQQIAEAGCGALIYLHAGQPGYGIDTGAGRVLLHREQRNVERGLDRSAEGHVDPQRTLREVGLGGQILSDLGIRKIRLLTNRPAHVPALQGFGIEIVEQVAIRHGVAAK
jgi:3,4-dihydroxy 2-butanone 4-phosphate synthase/GTP cyclohydrolase II